MRFVLTCALGWSLAAAAVAADATWEKLADPPRDLLGRECPPGLDGAWVYVPEWKGFLLYGGFSPSYSNEGWFFDPDKKEWTLLWAHDALAMDPGTKKWRMLMPREITWSTDRPGPARGYGAAYIPENKQVLFAGGHPTTKQRGPWWGPTRTGLWALDPAKAQFQHLGDDGPGGIVTAVFDSANRMMVTAPLNRSGDHRNKDMVTWVYSLGTGKWELRPSPNVPLCPQSGFAYDEKVRKCVLFMKGQTWTYDAAANAWAEARPAKSPPDRVHAGLCFDRARGLTILHGGVVNDKGWNNDVFPFEPKVGGKAFTDTWAYDAVKNEWTELKPAQSPPLTFSTRDHLAYDPDREACVFYDVAVGVWALSSGARPAGPRPAALPAPVPKAAPAKPVLDAEALAWQEKLKAIPDDSWLDTGVRLPAMGCMNTMYDPHNRCIVQIGGCGGAVHQSVDDDTYHNGVWIFDMDVGRFHLRRANHSWGPAGPEFRNARLPAGCTRGFCFDGRRRAVWCIGGNGKPLLSSPRAIRSYDVAADVSSPAGPSSPVGDGECQQLVYDSKHDVVVYVDTRRQQRTFLYSPEAKAWTDGGPAPVPCCAAAGYYGYANRAYDPEIGVIAILRTAKDWMPGQPWPAKPDWAMRTLAYDAGAKQWRDLAPAGQDKVPGCNTPGIAYDSRNRAVLFIKGDYGGSEKHSPDVPYGTLYVLDLAANAWKEGKAAICGGSDSGAGGMVAYDANHNVFLRFGRNAGYNTLLLYRYKGGCPADAFSGK